MSHVPYYKAHAAIVSSHDFSQSVPLWSGPLSTRVEVTPGGVLALIARASAGVNWLALARFRSLPKNYPRPPLLAPQALELPVEADLLLLLLLTLINYDWFSPSCPAKCS